MHVKTAMLKYFKPVNSKLDSKAHDNALSDPDLSLNKVIPSTAIAKANETVSEVLHLDSNSFL